MYPDDMRPWVDALKGTNQVAAGTGACPGDQCANTSFHGLGNFTTSAVPFLNPLPYPDGENETLAPPRRGGLKPAALAKFAGRGESMFPSGVSAPVESSAAGSEFSSCRKISSRLWRQGSLAYSRRIASWIFASVSSFQSHDPHRSQTPRTTLTRQKTYPLSVH